MIKKVSIITINYNGLKDTVEMIESLAIHETYPHEIIVVDNASTDPLEHNGSLVWNLRIVNVLFRANKLF